MFVYFGLIGSQLLTLIGYIVVTIGATQLQKRANNLPLWQGLNSTQLDATIPVYNDVFQVKSPVSKRL